jgi:putative FmdB family regulatory protein
VPTYDYECQRCDHRFEVFQTINEERKKRCPECNGKVRRLLGSGAGIIFKGSGFYETDYKKKKEPPKEPPKVAKSTDQPKEPKPAESAESKDKGASSKPKKDD